MPGDGFDVLVIGEGLSGICAAASSLKQGAKVALVSKGPGAFMLGTGCVDLERLTLAKDAVPQFRSSEIEAAVAAFMDLTSSAGCGYEGGMGERRLVPTSLGTFAEVSLAPSQLWKGDPRAYGKAVVVGIENVFPFDANFVAERLTTHSRNKGLSTLFHAASIALPNIHNQEWLTLLEIAADFDRNAIFRQALIDALKPVAKDADLLLIPGVFGLETSDDELRQVESEIGCAICELPTIPPSVPGLRLVRRLEARLAAMGVEIVTGFGVRNLQIAAQLCIGARIETPGKPRTIAADCYILAAGQFSHLLSPAATPMQFNERLQPMNATEGVVAENLFACGSVLGGAGARDKNAVDIITGYQAGILACQQGVHYAKS